MAQSSVEQFKLSGIQLQPDACVVIVRTEWNSQIVDILEDGCKKVLVANKIEHTTIVVPGAFEVGFAIHSYWQNHQHSGKPDAFIALGCVLRGDTPHFEYVCNAITENISQLNIKLPVPTIFGVLTVNTQGQADERTGGIHGHKGEEAAITAIKMIALNESFKTK